jgi:hypothetical protein
MPSPLRLNLAEGAVSFSFSPEAAQDLKKAIALLMESLKATATQGAGSRPNIWASPFAARVLITLRDDRIRLNTEAELTRLIEDVNQYLEQFS